MKRNRGVIKIRKT